MRQRDDQLQVEVAVSDRAVDVRVAGEIDIATVAQFRSVLWAQPVRPLLRLDLSEVSVFSAAAIRTLIAAHLGVRARGGELVLVDPHPMIVRVLRGTGLHRVVPVVQGPTRVTLPAQTSAVGAGASSAAGRRAVPPGRPVGVDGPWGGVGWAPLESDPARVGLPVDGPSRPRPTLARRPLAAA
ncbi:STAS domain-containing protein [Micromonospora sp. WMMD882]|uniref:STAS domain-containing protein n=1 Tax=Micromonospora sp. WMMD882 TaxID=3015151 RepID=UPI00248D1FBB|nr:STAS domain-containing protein [Micromonospora sp. WMMD882]WBB80884.1 STAS domain-containing protein [Micromonospora sp. WMMD882]